MNSCSVDILQTFTTTLAEIELVLSSLDETKPGGPDSIPSCVFRHLSQHISNLLSVLLKIIRRCGSDVSLHLGRLMLSRRCSNQDHLPKVAVTGQAPYWILLPKFLRNVSTTAPIFTISPGWVFICMVSQKKRSIFTNRLPYAIYKCMDEKLKTVSTFFSDLAKAFDKFAHKLLFTELYAFGIRGQLHWIIKSFF